jgi:hypothetical protein
VLVAQGETIKGIHKSDDLLWVIILPTDVVKVCVCGPNKTRSDLVIYVFQDRKILLHKAKAASCVHIPCYFVHSRIQAALLGQMRRVIFSLYVQVIIFESIICFEEYIHLHTRHRENVKSHIICLVYRVITARRLGVLIIKLLLQR